MARINIEDCWWTDPRRSKLIRLVGSEEIADGLAVRMWRLAQEFWGRGRKRVPLEIFETFEAAPKLIEAKLAIVEADQVYIRGSSQYLDWINEKRAAGAAGGKKSAESRRKTGNLQPKPRSTTEADSKQTRSKSKQIEPSSSFSGSSSGSSSDSGDLVPTEPRASKPQAFIAGYCQRFKSRWGTNPEILPEHAGKVARWVSTWSLDKIELYLDAYFEMPDAFLVKNKHAIGLFGTKLAETVVYANSGQFTTDRQAREADSSATNALLLEKVRRGEI